MNTSKVLSKHPSRAEISPPPSRKRKRSDCGPGDGRTSLQPPIDDHWLRIYSWNINGIAPFIQPAITAYFRNAKKDTGDSETSVTASLRGFLRRHRWPQILQLQEVKINPNDEKTQRAVERAINADKDERDDGPQYLVRFCLPNDPYNARGFGRKVYGVATIIRQDFYQNEVETIRTVDWDLEGRILIVETKKKLSIWNIYAVNGTMNDYKSPETGQVVGTRHDRKLAVHHLLVDECKRLETDGYRVVLAGDMNVAPALNDGFPNLRTYPEQHVKNRADFNAKFFAAEDGLRGIDSFRHLHPNEKKYTWVARNKEFATCCDRVDHIILSRSLVEGHSTVNGSLKGADILMTAAERGFSDHVPLFVSLDLECLGDSLVDGK